MMMLKVMVSVINIINSDVDDSDDDLLARPLLHSSHVSCVQPVQLCVEQTNLVYMMNKEYECFLKISITI